MVPCVDGEPPLAQVQSAIKERRARQNHMAEPTCIQSTGDWCCRASRAESSSVAPEPGPHGQITSLRSRKEVWPSDAEEGEQTIYADRIAKIEASSRKSCPRIRRDTRLRQRGARKTEAVGADQMKAPANKETAEPTIGNTRSRARFWKRMTTTGECIGSGRKLRSAGQRPHTSEKNGTGHVGRSWRCPLFFERDVRAAQ